MHDTGKPAQKQEKKSSLIRICILGSEGSGKTCFLAGLAVLGEPNRPTSLSVMPADQGTARYLDELANTLRRHEWPPPTNMTSVLTIRVGVERSLIEIVVVDYPGEDFREALRTLRYEQIETLYEHYSQADSILLLFDPHTDLLASGTVSERQIERQMAHLRAIADIWAERCAKQPGGAHSHVDVGVVLTKCDTVPQLLTPPQAKSYFRTHAVGLDQKIRQNADQVKYFALSAIGAQHDGKAPNEPHASSDWTLQPFGYDQLFQWIRQRHARRRSRRRRLAMWGTALALLAVFATYSVYRFSSRSHIKAILQNSHLSTFDKLQDTTSLSDDDLLRDRADLLRRELARVENNLRSADSEPAIDRIVSELEQYRHARPGPLKSEIDELLQEADKKKKDILFSLVNDSYNNKDKAFPSHADKFLLTYSNDSSRCNKVRELLGVYRTQQQQDARQRIKAIRVDNQSSLHGKSARIFEFLEEYGKDLQEREKDLMKRAAELGRQFSERHTYAVTLKRSGGFKDARYQGVWLAVGGKIVVKRDSEGASTSVTWPKESLMIQWQSGEPVKVILRDRDYEDEDVAWIEDSGAVALRQLGSKQVFTQFAPKWKEYCDEAFIECQIDGISPEDWKAVEAYLTPGTAW